MMGQPPATSAYLRDYIEKLKLEARKISAVNSQNIARPENPVDRYTHQIISWISGLPESQQKQAYTMDSIIKLANLKGIYMESPSPQQIAPALRKAGFQQVRSWKKVDRNVRVWLWSSSVTKPPLHPALVTNNKIGVK